VPIVMSRRVQLLDDKVVVAQFLNLVRKVGRGTAREIIDHRVGWRDDVANACAAACVRAAVPADSGEIVAVNLGRSRSRGKVDWRGLDPSLPISGGRWSITRLT